MDKDLPPPSVPAPTPGPWEARKSLSNNNLFIYIKGTQTLICGVNRNIGGIKDEQQGNANAAAILALLDLLAACQKVVAVHGRNSIAIEAVMCREAIDKALRTLPF